MIALMTLISLNALFSLIALIADIDLIFLMVPITLIALIVLVDLITLINLYCIDCPKLRLILTCKSCVPQIFEVCAAVSRNVLCAVFSGQ